MPNEYKPQHDERNTYYDTVAQFAEDVHGTRGLLGYKQALIANTEQEKNMSLHPQGPGSIPEETVRVAHAICPRGTLYMRI